MGMCCLKYAAEKHTHTHIILKMSNIYSSISDYKSSQQNFNIFWSWPFIQPCWIETVEIIGHVTF